MGIYLNGEDPYFMYKSETLRPFFVDKSKMLEELIPLVQEGNQFICVTRPRRFGKTIMANMIGAFFSCAHHAEDIFDSLNIAASLGYRENLNQHDVIYIDFSEIDDECKSYTSYIRNIKELLKEDLHTAYPEIMF
ncbi:MAG: AAA family ATPase, partial [Acetatifactor sp.]|nr:AAA family ATPase [Acetatifactor sp.]